MGRLLRAFGGTRDGGHRVPSPCLPLPAVTMRIQLQRRRRRAASLTTLVCCGFALAACASSPSTETTTVAGRPQVTDLPTGMNGNPPAPAYVVAVNDSIGGAYLTVVGGCNDCHTANWAETNGQVPPAQQLTGTSLGYRGPWGTSYAANLRLVAARVPEDRWVEILTTADGGHGRPPMPWMNTAQMADRDLRAIYRYIHSLGPAGERTPRAVPPGRGADDALHLDGARSRMRVRGSRRRAYLPASRRFSPIRFPTTPMPIAQTMLPEFDHEMSTTRALLERVPQEHAEWKPHTRSMGLGQLASHIGNIPTYGVAALTGDELDLSPTSGAPSQPDYTNTPTLLRTFDEHVRQAREAIAAAGDEQLREMWVLKNGGRTVLQLPRVAVLRTLVMNHLIHHRGQLSVYLRLLDVPLPSIYGPSADSVS